MREPSMEELAENVNNPRFGDDRLGVQFYNRVVEDVGATRREGRKIFREREYIKILVPGDRTNVVDRPVQKTGIYSTDDTMRFAAQYDRFQKQQEQKIHDGLPLSLWPQMPAALAKELEHFNIFTVEQLAELSDTYASRMPKGYEWKQKAATFVAALKDQSIVSKMEADLAERDNEIETLKQAVAEQAAAIEELKRKK